MDVIWGITANLEKSNSDWTEFHSTLVIAAFYVNMTRLKTLGSTRHHLQRALGAQCQTSSSCPSLCNHPPSVQTSSSLLGPWWCFPAVQKVVTSSRTSMDLQQCMIFSPSWDDGAWLCSDTRRLRCWCSEGEAVVKPFSHPMAQSTHHTSGC